MAGRSPEEGMLMWMVGAGFCWVGGEGEVVIVTPGGRLAGHIQHSARGLRKVQAIEPKARPCASQYRVVSVVDEDGDSRRFAGFEGGVIHGDAVGHGVFLSME